MKTTLNQIQEKSPCTDGWKKLLRSLNKTKANDDPVTIAQIIDSNGLDDALWCLRAVKGRDREIRLYAVWCARQVQHMMTNPRGLAALDVAERFAIGEATEADLAAARDAAGAAAGEEEDSSAWVAAWEVAGAAAWAAAGAAAWEAAWATEDSAARAAVWAAQENRLRELCAECESGVNMIEPTDMKSEEL